MGDSADQRRSTPINADQLSGPLNTLIGDALPLLMRDRVIGAVLAAQAISGGPVTSQEARAAKPVMRHARAFAEVAGAIARLGPDERGRTLRAAGRDRKGFALWWVHSGAHGPEA